MAEYEVTEMSKKKASPYPTTHQLAKWERETKHLGLPRSITQALKANGESMKQIVGISKNAKAAGRKRKTGIAQITSKSARRKKFK